MFSELSEVPATWDLYHTLRSLVKNAAAQAPDLLILSGGTGEVQKLSRVCIFTPKFVNHCSWSYRELYYLPVHSLNFH